MTSAITRWRGLTALLGAAVENGASAIERVHMATARRPFDVLEQIPGVDEPTRVVRALHDGVVFTAYGSVRAVTRLVAKTVDVALELVDEERAPRAEGAEGN